MINWLDKLEQLNKNTEKWTSQAFQAKCAAAMQ